MAKLYSDSEDFSVILQNIHNAMFSKMRRNTAKRDALELQTILQEIKKIAMDLNSDSDSVIQQAMASEFYELIKTAFMFQSQYHTSRFQMNTLFQRADKRGGRVAGSKAADSIFEEDLASILAAGEFLGGNKDIHIEAFLTGGQSAVTRAVSGYQNIDNLTTDLDTSAEKLIQQLAEKENRRAATAIRGATGKIDISGKAVTLEYEKQLPFKVERLMELMKDATFSAKNYNSKAWSENKKDLATLGLHLGKTNLFKAVTGALSEVQMGYKQQTSFFYRGMATILYNSHGYGEMAREHFAHLRFIYELRGSGLLDAEGFSTPVKYMIYNDPSSDAIYVKDTASIILEALESASKANNLLSEVTITAAKIKS